MSKAIVNNQFRIYSAQKFIEGLYETQLSANNLFLWVGKSTPWANEADPDAPNDSVSSRKASFVDMLAAKKVSPSDCSLVIPRHDWLSGTVYAKYLPNGVAVSGIYLDQFDPSTGSAPFFVFTDDNNVYKCLDNNNGGVSSVKPTGTSTSEITTADGYVWKFMYSLSPTDIQKFLSASWVPVRRITANDGSDQWAVQQTAVETLTSPPGGHGKDAVTELGAMYVMVSVKLQYDESGKVSTANDFRKYGLLVNPLHYGSSQYYASLVGVMTTNITLSSVVGSFGIDNDVEGGNSGATAKVVDVVGSVIRLTEVSGTFEVGEVLTDLDGGATAIVNSITNPNIHPNSGYILTTEHAEATARAGDQLENFKIVLAF